MYDVFCLEGRGRNIFLSVAFFASPKKEPKKGAFYEGVFLCFSIEHMKNRLKSAKFFPRLQKFLTRFSNYTDVKDPI